MFVKQRGGIHWFKLTFPPTSIKLFNNVARGCRVCSIVSWCLWLGVCNMYYVQYFVCAMQIMCNALLWLWRHLCVQLWSPRQISLQEQQSVVYCIILYRNNIVNHCCLEYHACIFTVYLLYVFIIDPLLEVMCTQGASKIIHACKLHVKST